MYQASRLYILLAVLGINVHTDNGINMLNTKAENTCIDVI